MFQTFLVCFLIVHPTSWPIILLATTLNWILGSSKSELDLLAILTVALLFALWPSLLTFLFLLILIFL